MTQNSSHRPAVMTAGEITNAFLRGVYSWMCIGLAATGVTAWIAGHNEQIYMTLFSNSMIPIILIIAQFGAVIALSAAVHKMSEVTATAIFMGYSVLTGLTLSSIFLVYDMAIITKAFGVAAASFGALSVYGLVTKRDLTGLGSLMFAGLIGIIVAMIINFFMKSPALHYAISVIGVVVFLGLTAYDTQKLRNMGLNAPHDDPAAIRKGTILGALTLYLDFINLFLMLLRIFGSRD